jgi:hypothetical protein
MVYVPEQHQLVTAAYDNVLRVYDASGAVKEAWSYETRGRVTSLAVNVQQQQVGGWVGGWQPPHCSGLGRCAVLHTAAHELAR